MPLGKTSAQNLGFLGAKGREWMKEKFSVAKAKLAQGELRYCKAQGRINTRRK